MAGVIIIIIIFDLMGLEEDCSEEDTITIGIVTLEEDPLAIILAMEIILDSEDTTITTMALILGEVSQLEVMVQFTTQSFRTLYHHESTKAHTSSQVTSNQQ